jgi:hypothetical protein
MVKMDNIFFSGPIRSKMLYNKFIFNMLLDLQLRNLRILFGPIFYAYYLHFQEFKISAFV